MTNEYNKKIIAIVLQKSIIKVLLDQKKLSLTEYNNIFRKLETNLKKVENKNNNQDFTINIEI